MSSARSHKTARTLPPTIATTMEAAYEKARQRKQLIVVYVYDKPGNAIPPLFTHRRIAISSRVSLVLYITDYVPKNDFFKSRLFQASDAPCVLILDHRGNLIKKLPVTIPAEQLAKQTFALRNLETGIEAELPNVMSALDKAIIINDEAKVIAITQPWLKKHYRGYDQIDLMAKQVTAFAMPQITAASELEFSSALDALKQIVIRYEHTPVEAEARVAIAALHAGKQDMKAVREICEYVLEQLPWPENQAAHQKATRLMRQVRRAEILRRRKIIEEERRKRLAATNTQK